MAKILIIEDDFPMREIMGEILSLDKYEYLMASDGQEGLDLYRSEKPDLVITDLIMPNKDGVSVVEEIKQEFPDARILVLSGSIDLGLFEKVVKLNANRVMTKPFTSDQLLDAVAEMVDEDAHANNAYRHHHYPI